MTLRFKTIKNTDKEFYFRDDNGNIIPRAGFEFTSGANEELKKLFLEAISAGWVRPVAHIKASEHMWEQLGG